MCLDPPATSEDSDVWIADPGSCYLSPPLSVPSLWPPNPGVWFRGSTVYRSMPLKALALSYLRVTEMAPCESCPPPPGSLQATYGTTSWCYQEAK